MDIKKIGRFIDPEGALRVYLNEIRTIKPLTREEERQAFIDWKENGNEESKIKIVKANQKFVVSVAKKYGNSENILDLISEGNIGLLNAMENFDYNCGVKFISYAVHYIRRNVSLFKIAQEPVIKKTNLIKTHFLINKIRNQFLQKNEREITNEELIEILRKEHDISINYQDDLMDINCTLLSTMDTENEDEYNFTTKDFHKYSASENLYENIIKDNYNTTSVFRLMRVLSPIQRHIVTLKYGIGCDFMYTAEQLAEITGYTTERVRQIVHKSLKIMERYAHRIGVDNNG
jgi:RNA polymerase primary sigma factor